MSRFRPVAGPDHRSLDETTPPATPSTSWRSDPLTIWVLWIIICGYASIATLAAVEAATRVTETPTPGETP